MATAYVVVTIVAAAVITYAAVADFTGPKWLLANMDRLGVPRSWMLPLGLAKAAGALGLLVGLAVPFVGVAAAVGLILFFVGAIVTVVRARWYPHYYPAVFLLLPTASLTLQVAS